MSFRAAILTRLQAPLEVWDVQTEGPAPGQVLVRMLCSGLCGAQLQEIDGLKPGGPLPHPLGHEGCGLVQVVGDGVRTVKPGDKVVLHWRPGAGMESDFPVYARRRDNLALTGGRVTTLGQYALVAENRVTAVPEETPADFCALLGCGLSTALGTIEHEARLLGGESILIVGCGGLGVNLLLAARVFRAARIVATDLHANKEGMATEMGAHRFVPFDDHGRFLAGERFDVIVNTSGAASSIERTLPLLAGGGRYILVGQPPLGAGVTIHNARHLFDGEGKTIKATQGGGFRPERDIPRYVAMHRAGLLPIEGLISHRFGLEHINEAVATVRGGLAGRVMIDL